MSPSANEAKPARRIIGIKNLVIDESLQSRVGLNMEEVKEFSDLMRDGVEFTPIDVFFDGLRYWLANGFHRVEAAKRAGLADVLANIRNGTKDDAYVFSAGANKKHCAKRTPADIQKAIEMLFLLDDWWAKGNAMVGRHVGVHGGTVARHRSHYAARLGKPIPDKLVSENGELKPHRLAAGTVSPFKDRGYRAKIAGMEFYGKTQESVTKKAGDFTGSSDFRVREAGKLKDHIVKAGVAVDSGFIGEGGAKFACLLSGEWVAVVASFHESPSVTVAAGRILMASHVYGGRKRMVVVGYKVNCNQSHIEIAESMGIEFLTPDEFLETLRPDAHSAD